MKGESLFFLINSRSGGTRSAKVYAALAAYAQQHPERLTVEEIEFSQLDAQLVRAQQFSRIIVGGGDGTVCSIASRLTKSDALVGILPLGTGNDLARELGFGRKIDLGDMDALCQLFLSATPRAVAVFRLDYGDAFSNRLFFINYASLGFDAEVVTQFDSLRRHPLWSLMRGTWSNRLAYAVVSLRSLLYRIPGAPRISMTQPDGAPQVVTHHPVSILFSNIKSVMGMGVSNPKSSPFDNQVECLVIRNPLTYAMMLLRYLVPLFPPQQLGGAESWTISALPPETPLQTDGESHGAISGSEVKISIEGYANLLILPR